MVVPVRSVGASPGADERHGRPARWALWLSMICGGTFVASIATIAIAYAIGSEDAVDDTWWGMLLAGTGLAGLLGSLVAFVLALVARARRERWVPLWLPLLAFPAAIVFLVLGEAFWWE